LVDLRQYRFRERGGDGEPTDATYDRLPDRGAWLGNDVPIAFTQTVVKEAEKILGDPRLPRKKEGWLGRETAAQRLIGPHSGTCLNINEGEFQSSQALKSGWVPWKTNFIYEPETDTYRRILNQPFVQGAPTELKHNVSRLR
jgi:hypothetical protein